MAYKYSVLSDGENEVIVLDTMQRIRKSDYFAANEVNAYFQAQCESDKRIKLVLEGFEKRHGKASIHCERKKNPHKIANAADWHELLKTVYTYEDGTTVVTNKKKIYYAKGSDEKTEFWVNGRYDGFVQLYKSKVE